MDKTQQSWIPLSRLGSGSFGHVSLALSLHDGALFAVKSATPAASAQLLNEIQILSSLSSPYIVRFLGADVGRRHLFLEFMESGSLNDAIRHHPAGRLPESLAGKHTHSILSALQYLHDTAGVVHGDVKSHNVLISASGSAKLADFGAAQPYDPENPASPRGGTPLWMAPEVALGTHQGPASDIWSLGCTVLEMLHGGLPWMQPNGSAAATLLKIACSAADPALPDTIVSDCSAAAQDFLRQCLRRDPDSRQSVAELLQHPFVKDAVTDSGLIKSDDQVRQFQLESPRSTLCAAEFSDCSSSDSSTVQQSEMLSDMGSCDSPARGNWITVKRSKGWSDDRQLNATPFTAEMGDGATAVVRKASEVRLDSIAFLMNRSARK